MVDPTFTRSVRRWLVAYPHRWRDRRTDEVVGLLADLAGPDATRLDVRSGLGLLVNGVTTRRRMRPPLGVRARYRLGLGDVPWQHRGWVADEIAGPMFQWRPLAVVAGTQVVFVASRVAGGTAHWVDLAWWLVWLVLMFVMPRTRGQRAAADRHLVARPGDPPTPWDVRRGWVLRDRLTARSALVPGCAAATAVAGVAAASSAATRTGSPVALAACLGLGLLGAARLAARWRSAVPARPAQPSRRLLAASRRTVASLWCWAAFAALSGWWEAPFSPDGITGAPVVLGAVLVVLPTLAIGAVAAVRGPADLAAVDVWRLLVGHGALRVDGPARGVVPAWTGDPGAAGAAAPTPVDPATA